MTDLPKGVQKLEGEEIIDWLKKGDAVTFRYKANKAGLWVMFFFGLAAFVVAGFLLARSDLALLIHKAAFSVLALFGGWCWWKPIRWGIFAVRSYVALSPDKILIGSGKKAELIDLEQINPETVDLENMQTSLYTNVLPVKIGTFESQIFLVGLYVHLEELEAFMGEILQHIAPEQAQKITG
jgi:pheromone shutdown protein TraB